MTWRWGGDGDRPLLGLPEKHTDSAEKVTHVHKLHVGFGSCGLVQDLYGHRDLHCLPLGNPDTLGGGREGQGDE